MNTATKMELCEYEELTATNIGKEKSDKFPWTPFLRQTFICSGICSLYFVLGLCFGAPTVFIHQIRKEANSTDAVSPEMESWLSSVHGYSSSPWVIILSILSHYMGRKIPFMFVGLVTLISFIVFYCSTTTTHLLLSEIMQGVLLASNMTILVPSVTEYTSTRFRPVFVTIESSMFFWGVWVANALGIFLHWRNIGILAIVFTIYTATVVFWPESPYWLAMKGRYKECAMAHHWLRGYDPESEKELEELIKSQKEYIPSRQESKRSLIQDFIRTISSKPFYKPILLSLSVLALYNFSGKMVCSMYSIKLIKKITKSDTSTYVGVLVIDGVTIISMHMGSVLVRLLKRRTMFLGSSLIGIMLLFLISIYLYLIKYSILIENNIISITLLTLFSMVISGGPMATTSCLFGELAVLRYKSVYSIAVTLFSELLMATILKIFPFILNSYGLHNAFLFYSISASIFLIVLYVYLPETKGKSLVDIENIFKDECDNKEGSNDLINKNNRNA